MSNKNFTTLNHLYDAPVPHRRNFVRENKESVSRFKHMKEKPLMGGELSNGHISSQSSGYSQAMLEHVKKIQAIRENKTKPCITMKKQPWTYGREASDRKAMSKTVKITPISPKQSKRAFPSNASNARGNIVNNLKTKTSSIAVQTDEINDEIYLYNALKKCASPAFKSALKAKYTQKDRYSHLNQQQLDCVNQETLSLDDVEEDIKPEHCRQIAGDDNKTKAQNAHQCTQTFSNQNSTRSALTREQEDYKTDSQLNVMTMPAEGFKSCSPSKCTNCPLGYHLLGDAEREAIRAKLLEHERVLIKQLNSFPLAIETLRVRQCKTRIEKELSILEQNLRKLTKRKVYAKIHE